MAMKEIDIREVKENLVHLLADEWALVTAGRGDALGTMTVSWGGIGELWGKDMATIYIRPQRYTKKFLDENNYFTLSFYPEQYKDALRLCGSKSGREINKVEATGLTPCYYEKAPYFEEAKLVLVCRKVAVSAFGAVPVPGRRHYAELCAKRFSRHLLRRDRKGIDFRVDLCYTVMHKRQSTAHSL